MQIKLDRLNDGVHFRASDNMGHSAELDGSENSEFGTGQGLGPMQLVLFAAAGCTAFDIVGILKKQRQPLRDIKIIADAERADGAPSPFVKIHLHYDLFGDLEDLKVSRAVSLAVEKYCSVLTMLQHSADISYGYKIQ